MRFQALDGWRGVAALMVAIYHAPFLGHIYDAPLVRNAYLFVDLFFVLSGFVISHAYASRLSGTRSVLVFLIRRFGRLWPLHAAVLAAFVVIEIGKLIASHHGLGLNHAPFSGGHSIAAIAANLGLVHSLGLYDHVTWNGPSWSISVEFWTYLIFAVTAMLRPRRLVLIAAAIVVVMPAAIWSLSAATPVADVTYDYGLLRCVCGFFLGYLTHRVFAARAMSQNPPAGAMLQPWLVETIAVAGVAVFVVASGDGAISLAAPFVFAGAIYVFAAERGPISRVLRSPPGRWLGKWSYSIYMTHLLVLTIAVEMGHALERLAHIPLLRPLDGRGDPVFMLATPHPLLMADVITVVYAAATVALSAPTYRFIEAPARAYFARAANAYAKQSEESRPVCWQQATTPAAPPP